MRIRIEIDDELIAEAIKASGARGRNEVVELGLKTLIQIERQGALRELRGKLAWEDDLNRSRSD